jgi:DNA-binding transcriptional LysR family regulator
MTLQQLRTLLAIVRFGSFRRASRELGVSQAGLTTSLRSLEEALDMQLLVRSPHGISLTEQGRLVFERAQVIEREAAHILQASERARGAYTGTLHVGIGPTPTALLLHLVVPDFHSRFPDVRLKLLSGVFEHLHPALQQGRIELAVAAVPEDGVGPDLNSIGLFKSDLVVIARAGHAMGGASSLQELSACEWVLLGSPGGPGGSISRFFANQGLAPPGIAATCESLTQLAALVRGTDWLAMVPGVLVKDGLLGSGLCILALKQPAPQFENCVIYRREPALTPAAQAFAAMCQSCARALALSTRSHD